MDKPREKQHCSIELTIDFTSRLVNGSVDARPSSLLAALKVDTVFSLENPSVVAKINYKCSTTDYCDQEFIRETLRPALANMRPNTLRQNLIDCLYNSSNNNTISCSYNSTCATDEYCKSSYLYIMYADMTGISQYCSNSTNSPEVRWTQIYAPFSNKGITNFGVFDCNKVSCGDNVTMRQIVNNIKEQYVLPMNLSVLNTTLPPLTSTKPNSAKAFRLNIRKNLVVGFIASILLLIV